MTDVIDYIEGHGEDTPSATFQDQLVMVVRIMFRGSHRIGGYQ